MTVLPLHQLIRRALGAMVRPLQAFRAIRDDERLPNGRLIGFTLVWGAVYAVLHFHVMNGNWLWEDPPGIGRCRFLTFVLAGPCNWLVASFGLWHLARWFKRPMAIERAEIIAFYLWMVWALMPLIDLVHLAGVPRWSLQTPLPLRVSFVAHASWLFAFPVILAELWAFFYDVVGDRAHRLLRSLALGLGLLIVVRVVLEPVPEHLAQLWRWGFPEQAVGDWWITVILQGLTMSIIGAWRWTERGGARGRAVTAALIGIAAVLLAVQPLRYY